MRSVEPQGGSARTVVRGTRRVTPDSDPVGTSPGTRPATGHPVVIKIGGRSLEAPGAPRELAAEVASLGDDALLVHGGGSEVSAWCMRLGLTPHFLSGLRVTDDETLEVAVAVLAGLANKRLVARLRESGVDAVGLSGLDGGVLKVERHPDQASLGHVGRVRAVSPWLLECLLTQGMTPVLSSIGEKSGELVNLNADEVAGAVAGSIGARALILLSDTPGLILEGQPVDQLSLHDLDRALGHPDVQGGMLPKLLAARTALEVGAEQVVIAAWHGSGTLAAILSGSGVGTRIHRDRVPTHHGETLAGLAPGSVGASHV